MALTICMPARCGTKRFTTALVISLCFRLCFRLCFHFPQTLTGPVIPCAGGEPPPGLPFASWPARAGCMTLYITCMHCNLTSLSQARVPGVCAENATVLSVSLSVTGGGLVTCRGCSAAEPGAAAAASDRQPHPPHRPRRQPCQPCQARGLVC